MPDGFVGNARGFDSSAGPFGGSATAREWEKQEDARRARDEEKEQDARRRGQQRNFNENPR